MSQQGRSVADSAEVDNGVMSLAPGLKWRDRLLGAVVGTMLSVMGGVALHYLIREPPPPPPEPEKPHLAFDVSAPTSFVTAKTRVAIYLVKFWNDGTKEAEDVRLSVSFPPKSKVVDAKIEPSAGPTVDYKVLKHADSWLLTFPIINPRESCQAAFLLKTGRNDPLQVSLRSKGDLGGQVASRPSSQTTPVVRSRLCVLVDAAVVVQIVVLILLYVIRRKRFVF